MDDVRAHWAPAALKGEDARIYAAEESGANKPHLLLHRLLNCINGRPSPRTVTLTVPNRNMPCGEMQCPQCSSGLGNGLRWHSPKVGKLAPLPPKYYRTSIQTVRCGGTTGAAPGPDRVFWPSRLPVKMYRRVCFPDPKQTCIADQAIQCLDRVVP